jgi:hypothetical protein
MALGTRLHTKGPRSLILGTTGNDQGVRHTTEHPKRTDDNERHASKHGDSFPEGLTEATQNRADAK